MKPLNPDRSAFGRHETFPLRFGWLTKGYQAWKEDPGVFEREDATVRLGVGKNMVTAIRYWMLATRTAKQEKSGLQATAIGSRIFDEDGWDPYLEDDATLWLLHWLLASNAEQATGLFWFFNRFRKPEFTAEELAHALKAFVAERLASRVSESTLKHEVTLLIRMYEPTAVGKGMPLEESLDSPMATLGLIQPVPGTKSHESRPEFRASLPPAILGFATAELFETEAASALPVERLLHGDGVLAAPGSVFRLSEECLIAKLEDLIAWLPGAFELRETAGIHQIYRLAELATLAILERHYGGRHRGTNAYEHL